MSSPWLWQYVSLINLCRFKNDSALTQSYKHMQKYMGKEYELRISRIKMDDKGEYCVRAENSFGRKDETVNLKVERKLT